MPEIEEKSHRGGFGDLGGEERGLIDRSFRERIIAVGFVTEGKDEASVLLEVEELCRLINTAGADVVEIVIQKKASPDPATFVGKGKAREIYELAETLDVDSVVFNDELTPGQQFNLEKIFHRSALDRTAVILDILHKMRAPLKGKHK